MYQIDFNHPVHVHFVGIGGISMSGLAQILASEGFTVSGSDRAASEITRTLEKSGIRVMIGQRRENITKDIDLAVFTAAIHPDNPEYKAVQEMKRKLVLAGADAACMTGSGAAVFGIFKTEKQAMAAAKILAEQGIAASVCHPTDEGVEFITE